MERPDPLPLSAAHRRLRVDARLVVPLLVIVLAGVLLYRSPWSASGLEIVPDSVEYAVVAQRFATLGRMDLSINGVSYPSRYPPWFSVLMAPFYALAPHSPGIGILVVLAFAFAGLLAAYAIGRRLAGEWGGVAAALFLMTYRGYAAMARLIMTDVPAVALGLIGCSLYLRMRERAAVRDYLIAGLIAAGAMALRNECIVYLFPFLALALSRKERRLVNLAALLLPGVCIAAATGLYNLHAFGDWRRTGYQYWLPLPYDYRQLVLSPRYLQINLDMLKAKQVLYAVALGSVGTVLLWRQRSAELRPILLYLALAALPLTLIHLFYFYPAYRFHLLGLSLCCILGGAGLATLVPETLKRPTWLLPALLAAGAVVVLLFVRRPDPEPDRRLAAEALARATPPNAVIVTNIDAVYLEPLVLRGTQRRIVPLSRSVEYASKCIAPHRLDLPPSAQHYTLGQRFTELLRYGAQNVFPVTAEEDPNPLALWVHEGVPVYIDLRPPAQFSARTLGEYRLEPNKRSPWLMQLIWSPARGRRLPVPTK